LGKKKRVAHNKKTTEQYKLELEEVNKKNSTNIRLKNGVEYIGNKTKIIHICTCGKEWNTIPYTILSSKSKNCGLCNTFKDWCIENNRQDVLDRWDYELNDKKPDKIGFSTHKQYYFKCPIDIHKSELKIVRAFTNGQEGSMYCKACNSIAQFGIDNIGENFLEKYWDYGKNTVNPWEISKGNDKKVWIKCQEKDYHKSYDIACSSFVIGSRCSYCANHKVHPLDSLGKILEDKGLLHLWSDKNKKPPYEYKPNSSKEKVYWKCPEGKHKDYPRSINSSNVCDFRCPDCMNEQKESIMASTLKQVLKYKYLDTEWEHDIGFRTKKNRISRYDIFVSQLDNLLIECQSEYHDTPKQQKIDILKKQYAIDNNYNYMALDSRDYTPLEAIQIFFSEIKEIPDYVDISKETIRNWNLIDAQELLNKGHTYQEVADMVGTQYCNIQSHINRGVLKKPKNYKKKYSYPNRCIKVVCLGINNKLIEIYNSIAEAGKKLNINSSSISRVCKGKKKSAGGYKWMYHKDYICNQSINQQQEMSNVV